MAGGCAGAVGLGSHLHPLLGVVLLPPDPTHVLGFRTKIADTGSIPCRILGVWMFCALRSYGSAVGAAMAPVLEACAVWEGFFLTCMLYLLSTSVLPQAFEYRRLLKVIEEYLKILILWLNSRAISFLHC